MNSKITRYELITHDMNWYWKHGWLRGAIREHATNMPEQLPRHATLPELSVEGLNELMGGGVEIIDKILATYDIAEYHDIYNAVFIRKSETPYAYEKSPVTLRIDHFWMPYEGVLATFLIADKLLTAEAEDRFIVDRNGKAWLNRTRFTASVALREFTNHLTRVHMDSASTYGSLNQQGVVRVWATDTRHLVSDAELVLDLFPSDLNVVDKVRMTITPTGISYVEVGHIVPKQSKVA